MLGSRRGRWAACRSHGQPFRQDDGGLPAVDPSGKRAPAVEEHHEQQAQADAGDDIRIGHGNIVDGHERCGACGAYWRKADGSHGAQNRSHGSWRCRETSSVVARLFKMRVSEKRSAYQWKEKPVQTVRLLESLKGKDDQHEDGCVHEDQARGSCTPGRIRCFSVS